MKRTMLLICLSLLSAKALAGSWSYGCIGHLPDQSVINFNRNVIAVVPTAAPGQFAANEVSDPLRISSTDVNSGFQKVMSFQNDDGTTVTLTELSSIKLSDKNDTVPCTGNRGRDLEDVRYEKTYSIELPNRLPVQVPLKCYELQISTCG